MLHLALLLFASLPFTATSGDQLPVPRHEQQSTADQYIPNVTEDNPASESFDAGGRVKSINDLALREAVAAQFEFCQVARYDRDLGKGHWTWENRDERDSMNDYAYIVWRRLVHLKKRHNINDIDIVSAGLSSGHERLFVDHCLYTRRSALRLAPEATDRLAVRVGSKVERRIDMLESQLSDAQRGLQTTTAPVRFTSHSEVEAILGPNGPVQVGFMPSVIELRNLRHFQQLLDAYDPRTIFVRTAMDRLRQLDVLKGDTVADLMRDLQSADGISLDEQILVYGGVRMEANRPIADYDIKNDATVILIRAFPSFRVQHNITYPDVVDDPVYLFVPANSDWLVEIGPGCHLGIPFGFDENIPPAGQYLLVNLSAGQQPGSILLNGVRLDDAQSAAPAYVVPMDEGSARAVENILKGRHGRYQTVDITRWTYEAKGVKRVTEYAERDWVVRILEVDGEPVRLPNIVLRATTRSGEPPKSIEATWTYYNVTRVHFA